MGYQTKDRPEREEYHSREEYIDSLGHDILCDFSDLQFDLRRFFDETPGLILTHDDILKNLNFIKESFRLYERMIHGPRRKFNEDR